MNNQPDTVPDQSVFQAGPTLGPPGIPGAPVAVGTVEEARDALFLAIDRFAFREAKLPEQSKVFQAVHDFEAAVYQQAMKEVEGLCEASHES